jgi:hypothetical protein
MCGWPITPASTLGIAVSLPLISGLQARLDDLPQLLDGRMKPASHGGHGGRSTNTGRRCTLVTLLSRYLRTCAPDEWGSEAFNVDCGRREMHAQTLMSRSQSPSGMTCRMRIWPTTVPQRVVPTRTSFVPMFLGPRPDGGERGKGKSTRGNDSD